MIMQRRISSAYIIIAPQSKIFTTRHHHHAPFRKVKSSTKISSIHREQSNNVLSAGRCEKSNIRCWASYDNDAQNSSSNDDDEPMKQQKDDVVGDEDYGRLDNNNYNWSAQTMAIALPALAGMMTDPILSMVDTLFVGQLSAPSSIMSTTAKSATSSSSSCTSSSIPLAALGACTSIFHLAFHCVKGTTATTASLVAGAVVRDEQTTSKLQYDEEDEDSSNRVTSTSQTLQQKETTLIAQTSMEQAFITGTTIALFLLIFGPNCLNAMGIATSSSSLFTSALTYLNHRAVAAPAVVLLTASEGIFRGFGDVITPWKVSLVVAGLNLILDPFCMFTKKIGKGNGKIIGLGMDIKGAAVATSLSQVCGAMLYGSLLLRKGVLGGSSNNSGEGMLTIAWKKLRKIASRKSDSNEEADLKRQKRAIATTILRANASMILKQGSLLLGWAYATSRATRMGHSIVAAHQMGLSIWMLFSYALDGISVAAQVLMAREYEELRIVESSKKLPSLRSDQQKDKVRSLSLYMLSASILQGLIASAAVLVLYKIQPSFFLTNNPEVRKNLLHLFPHLSAQMTLVSTTLVAEALTIGGGRFKWLAFGTTVSSLIAMARLRASKSLVGIWSGGIVALFIGRLLTALLAVLDMNGYVRRRNTPKVEKEAA